MNNPNGPAAQHVSDITTIAKGAGIVFLGTITGTLLKYLFEFLIARNLGSDLFGIFFLGFTIYKVLERISIIGLHNGVVRYIALFKGLHDNSRIKGTILLSIKAVLIAGCTISCLVILFSRHISSNIFKETDLSPILIIFSAGLVFTALTEILTCSTQAFKIMKYKVLVRMIFEPGIRLLLFLLFFYLGWKLLGAASAFLISTILGLILASLFLKKVFPLFTDKKVKPIYETRKILIFSWPLFVVGFLNLFIIQINTLMLGFFKTSHEVGIFGAAQRTAFIIPIILESFNSIFAPIIADLYNKKELKKLENLYKVVTKWIFTISFPIAMIFIFSAGNILNLWGGEYKEGTICLIIMCCAQLINCSVGSAGIIIMMTGRTKINLFNTITVFILVIVLNYLLIPIYGILGAAASLAAALGIINIIRLIEVYSLLKIHPYKIDFYKPFIAGGISIFILLALGRFIHPGNNNIISLLINVFIFSPAYVLILVLLKINHEDIMVLDYIKTKLFKRNTT